MNTTARELLGCRFHALTADETLDQMLAWSAEGERRTHIVVTVNVAILMQMRSDPKLAHAIRMADLVVADGAPVVWAGRWLRAALPERVTGVDLMERLLEKGAGRRLRVFLLGTTEQRLLRLVRVLEQRYRGVEIVGARNGYFTQADEQAVVAQIRESRPDILLVGMPAPFKETWCEKHRADLQTPIVLGVGGAFDVIAGFVARAPRALQTTGLEWAWRLAMEPRKLWRRYLTTNSQFVALLISELTRRNIWRA